MGIMQISIVLLLAASLLLMGCTSPAAKPSGSSAPIDVPQGAQPIKAAAKNQSAGLTAPTPDSGLGGLEKDIDLIFEDSPSS